MKLSIWTTSVTLVLSVGSVAADGAFLSSCESASVKVRGNTVTANCKNIVGILRCSKLNLNNCLRNSYGLIQTDPSGSGPHFTDRNQCVDCTNEKGSAFSIGGNSPSLLHCRCNPGIGSAEANWPTSFFDLDTLVSNNNGIMECYDSMGTAC